MEQLSEKQIGNLSFPDADVTKFEIDLVNKVLQCSTDLSLISGDENRLVGTTHFTIRNWTSMTIQEWDGQNFINIENRLKGSELKDIGENQFGEETILKGFTVGTGSWTEYKFVNAEVHVEISTQNPQGLTSPTS